MTKAHSKAAEVDPVEVNRKVYSRIEAIDKAWYRSGDLAIADMREGKPVAVNKPFKFDNEVLERGAKFHPGMSRVAAVIEMVNRPGQKSVLIPYQEFTDRQEQSKLRSIRERLAPLVIDIQSSATNASQAASELQAAEEAVKHWRAQLEAAQAKHDRAQREAADYIGGLDIDI
jgi:hypothetical protein